MKTKPQSLKKLHNNTLSTLKKLREQVVPQLNKCAQPCVAAGEAVVNMYCVSQTEDLTTKLEQIYAYKDAVQLQLELEAANLLG